MSQLIQILGATRYYVYALVCKDTAKDSIGYIKIGRSRNIATRLSNIKCSCPIPARYFAVVQVRDAETCARLEKALHEIFSNRRAGGEWFRFDMSCPASKQEFNQGCLMMFREVLGPKHPWWTKISIEALDTYARERRQEFMRSKHRKALVKEQKRKITARKAWKELSAYSYA